MPVGQNLEAGARITELLLVTEAKGVDGLSEQRPEGRAAGLHKYTSAGCMWQNVLEEE